MQTLEESTIGMGGPERAAGSIGTSSAAAAAGAMDAGEEDGHDSVVVIRTTQSKLRELEENLAKEIQNLNVVPKNIAYLNLLATAGQFLQAIFLLIFASRNDSQWYWYTSYSNPDTRMPVLKQVATFSILWYSPVFIIASGLEHLCCVIFHETYNWYLQRNQNPFRWAEYSFSASLMRVMIAQLVGVTDIHLLFCIFCLTALMIQLGSAHEAINAKALADGYKQNWRCFYLSWIAQLSTWFIIFNYFAVTVSQASPDGTTKLLWVIVMFLFVVDQSFAVLFTLQWMQLEPVGPNYIVGEKGFIMLSLLSKTLLAWLSIAAWK